MKKYANKNQSMHDVMKWGCYECEYENVDYYSFKFDIMKVMLKMSDHNEMLKIQSHRMSKSMLRTKVIYWGAEMEPGVKKEKIP